MGYGRLNSYKLPTIDNFYGQKSATINGISVPAKYIWCGCDLNIDSTTWVDRVSGEVLAKQGNSPRIISGRLSYGNSNQESFIRADRIDPSTELATNLWWQGSTPLNLGTDDYMVELLVVEGQQADSYIPWFSNFNTLLAAGPANAGINIEQLGGAWYVEEWTADGGNPYLGVRKAIGGNNVLGKLTHLLVYSNRNGTTTKDFALLVNGKWQAPFGYGLYIYNSHSLSGDQVPSLCNFGTGGLASNSVSYPGALLYAAVYQQADWFRDGVDAQADLEKYAGQRFALIDGCQTLKPLGDPNHSNMWPYPDDGTSWINVGYNKGTIEDATSHGVIAPDGYSKAWAFMHYQDALGDSFWATRTDLVVGNQYNFTFYARPGLRLEGGLPVPCDKMINAQSMKAGYPNICFDLTGAGSVVTPSIQYRSYSIEAIPGGWYKISYSFIADDTNSYAEYIQPATATDSGPVQRVDANTPLMYFWGPDFNNHVD